MDIHIYFKGGDLKWSDGSAFGFKNWAQDEPRDKQGMAKCVALVTGYSQETPWKMFNCDTSKWFFCKWKEGALQPIIA